MGTRVYFLDKLRSATILCVVAFHSAVSYSGTAGFWPYRGEEVGRTLDLLLYVLDIVMMPLMFFIAGYFSLPSYRRLGGWAFLKPKLIRLGIPWLIVTFLLLPPLDYLHYRVRLSGTIEIGRYILLSWKRICAPLVGYLSMRTYVPLIDQYYQRYMWFLSLLLFMYLTSPVVLSARDKLARGRKTSVASVVALLYALSFGFVFFVLGALRTGMNWFSLGNILQFQPVKLVYYLALFWFGVACHERGLFADRGLTKRSWPLGALAVLLLAPCFIFGLMLSRSASPELWMKAMYALSYTCITVTSTLFLLNLGYRRWNSASPFWSWISEFSYEIYLVHYAWVLTVPLAFDHVAGMPPVLKFLSVATISIVGSAATAFALHRLVTGRERGARTGGA